MAESDSTGSAIFVFGGIMRKNTLILGRILLLRKSITEPLEAA